MPEQPTEQRPDAPSDRPADAPTVTTGRRRRVRPRVAGRLARSVFRIWAENELLAGSLLLGAAILGLAWANSPWRGGFESLAGFEFGPAALGLHLDLRHWVQDGLLAIFFFAIGAELKQEFVVGALRNPRTAAVPVLAAIGGMIGPALVFVAVVLLSGDPASLRGWAIPTATDIAFAVGVLSVFGKRLPLGLRAFLLTLAVVDDLFAIIVIAIFYTASIAWLWLGVSVLTIIAFALLIRNRRAPWWGLIPLALIAWGAMHASGVHATIAGVALGLTVPATAIHLERAPRTHLLLARVLPWSTLIVLPIFAFFAAGVAISPDAFGRGETAVFLGVGLGLLLGKIIGIMGVTTLLTKFTPLQLADGLQLKNLWPIAMLTGIGFTVAMLIADLAFSGDPRADAAKLAVLAGSLVAAVGGATTLRLATRRR